MVEQAQEIHRLQPAAGPLGGAARETATWATAEDVRDANEAEPLPMRVKVLSGDRQQYLGEGDHVGSVMTWFWVSPNASLASLPECEREPSAEAKAGMEADGYELLSVDDNPKIVLDSGRVVYGCQVWWTRVE